MAARGGFTIRCCKELVKYVTCLLDVIQLPNSTWRPFLKIKIFMSGKTRKILEKSGNLVCEKKNTNPFTISFSVIAEYLIAYEKYY